MKVLVLGSGGREHAIAWKLGQCLGLENVFLQPGNAGTLAEGFRSLEEANIDDLGLLTSRAKEKGISLVVVGPETLLAEGYADYFRKEGFLVVGPNQSAARLETSKVFAKEFMRRGDIPTAPFEVVKNRTQLEQLSHIWPVVLKLDALASGKGVVIAQNLDDVRDFADRVWEKHEFGPPPHQVIVEKCLVGHEVSYMGLCDGTRFVPLSTATDYKRVGTGNTGLNTGGMGAISPSPHFNSELEEIIQTRIVHRILQQMARERIDFRGVLYIGLMISPSGDPFVLEFNTRFGDPETQAILLRLYEGFASLLKNTAQGTLDLCPVPTWDEQVALYVVAAAQGYPGQVKKGDKISGIETLPEDIQVFYSGVKQINGSFITDGGRVLGLGTLGPDTDTVRKRIYDALKEIYWMGIHYRTDIGSHGEQK